jgi:Predicted glutamine amidotransferases
MKRSTLFLLLVFSLYTACAQTKTVTRLGIVNPTPGNLRNAINLIETEYIHADSITIIGIYHQSQSSSIESTEEFLQNSSYNIDIVIINGEISIDSLFVHNGCTEEFRHIFEKTDALMLFGGADIVPRIYGEETLLTTEMVSSGKNWELSFLYHLIGGFQDEAFAPLLEKNPDYPILGICLGMQELNVASGGSLYQDIPFQIYGKTTYESILKEKSDNIHRNYWNHINNENDFSFLHLHPIRVTKGGFLDFKSLPGNPMVISAHHQAAKKIGKGFRVAATSTDGKVVEALQHTRYKNVYGIQFHTDFSILYEEDKEFEISPSEKIVLSEETRRFHKLFWENFSRRLP